MKLNCTYEEFFKLLTGFAAMPKPDRDITEFLFERDYFEGTVVDLVKNLGRKDNDAPNIRKAIHRLNDMGIVYIAYNNEPVDEDDKDNNTKKRMKACFLVDGWIDRLLEIYNPDKVKLYIENKSGDNIKIKLSETELIYAALMAYGNKLCDITSQIPNEMDITKTMTDRAKAAWNLAQRIKD